MPALLPTTFIGTITYLGRVLAKPAILASHPVPEVFASFSGVDGEVHSGLTRGSCNRVTSQYARGTTIRNVRQFSILGQEELDAIAEKMGLDGLDPGLLGASVVISGIPDFSHVPPSSRLQTEGGATLVVDMENRPCKLPSRGIEDRHPGKGSGFMAAAKGRRGVTAWVESEGLLRLGQTVVLHVPDQPVWANLMLARG